MSVIQSTKCDRCQAISQPGAGASPWLHVTSAQHPSLDFCSRPCLAAYFGGGSAGQPARVIVGGGGGAGSGIAAPNQTGGSSPLGFAGSTHIDTTNASQAINALRSSGEEHIVRWDNT